MNPLTPSEIKRLESLIGRLAQAGPDEKGPLLDAMGSDTARNLLRFAGAWGPSLDDLPRGFRCGDCELLEPLGAGGFGVVYRARQEGRVVAVKLLRPGRLDPAHRAGFEAEKQTLVHLGKEPGTGIVPLYAWGEVRAPGAEVPIPYLVMPLVDGEPLTGFCRRQKTLADRLETLARVADAVHFAHTADPAVVHGDLKPENILVTRSGRPVILDFGLARFLHPTQPAAALGGSVPYMAPEHFAGRFTARADVYALGVLAFEALTDQLPYDILQGQPEEYREAIEAGRVRRLRKVDATLPAALAKILARALAHDPARRPSALDFARTLRELATPPSKAPVIRQRTDLDVKAGGHLEHTGIRLKAGGKPKVSVSSRTKATIRGKGTKATIVGIDLG